MIKFASLALTLEEIFGATAAVVGADAPTVIAAINTTMPGTVSAQTSGYVALGEVGLSVVSDVIAAITAAHAAKVAAAIVVTAPALAPAATPAAPAIPPAAAAAPQLVLVPKPAAPVAGAVDVAQGEGLAGQG